MAAPNPYELSERGKANLPNATTRAVTFTADEQRAKLAGYVTVPPEFWPNVAYGTHVRFLKKAGEFQGGFILNNPFDTKVKGTMTEKRFFKLQSGFNKQAKDHLEWIIAYEDVDFLYAKGNGVELTLQKDLETAVSTIGGNLERLAAYAKKMDARCAKLEQRLAALEGRK